MARVPGRDAIYEFADLFRQRCLIERKSLLWPDRDSWELSNTALLWSAFVDRPDTSKRTFIEKWHDQLRDEPEDVHRIAADLIAFYQLFPTNVGRAAKLRDINTIVSWKLADDAPSLGMLGPVFEIGLGNPGIHYLTAKPIHITFYLRFVIRLQQERVDPQDAQAFKALADQVRAEVPQSGSARHILLHLMFPDLFERIASEGQRRHIVDVFAEDAGGAADQDEALLGIRTALRKRLNRDSIDFYDKDIWPQWDRDGADPIKFWVEKTIVRGRPDRESGEFAVGHALWSPKQDKRGGDIYRFMRELRPGDVVFHLTDNTAITAVSRVESRFQEFGGVSETEWGVGESYLVRLRDHAKLDPPLDRSVLFSSPFDEQLSTLVDVGTKNLFFNTSLSLNQGAYLTPAPPELVRIFDEAYEQASGKPMEEVIPEIGTIAKFADAANSWLFQANPDFYDVRAALRSLKEQSWLVARFKDAIKLGDTVYLWESGPKGGLVGVGDVIERPRMMLEREEERPFAKNDDKFEGERLRTIVRVSKVLDPPLNRKQLMQHHDLTGMTIFRQPQGTNYRLSTAEAVVLEGLTSLETKPTQRRVNTLAELSQLTNTPETELAEIESLLRAKGQIILEGPPGAGKTYLAELFARYLTGHLDDQLPHDNLLIVQFHQSYGYEDFIQGIRPRANDQGQLSYSVESGVFKKFCARARATNEPFVVVIDEINRGNISRIFGELLFLLEYRDKSMPLPYDGSFFSIPPNLFVIGTMNTTDRSLAQIDYALRRRFYFYRLLPVSGDQAPVLDKALRKFKIDESSRSRVLRIFLALNSRIQDRLGEHFQVGHSYFIREDIANEIVLRQVWDRAILPLLEEYFHSSRDRAKVMSEFSIEKLVG